MTSPSRLHQGPLWKPQERHCLPFLCAIVVHSSVLVWLGWTSSKLWLNWTELYQPLHIATLSIVFIHLSPAQSGESRGDLRPAAQLPSTVILRPCLLLFPLPVASVASLSLGPDETILSQSYHCFRLVTYRLVEFYLSELSFLIGWKKYNHYQCIVIWKWDTITHEMLNNCTLSSPLLLSGLS